MWLGFEGAEGGSTMNREVHTEIGTYQQANNQMESLKSVPSMDTDNRSFMLVILSRLNQQQA